MTRKLNDRMPDAKLTSQVEQAEADVSRRATLSAVIKFTAFVAPMTQVLLSANEAKAQPCSTHPSPQPGKNCT